MDMIKQYVDLLIRRKEEFLLYRRLHDEWKTYRTDEAWQKVAGTKAVMDNTEKEMNVLYHKLKDEGHIAGGDSPWGTEMMRYANWLSEHFEPGIGTVVRKQ